MKQDKEVLSSVCAYLGQYRFEVSYTFVLKAADDVGGGHGTMVISKTVIKFHHIFRWFFSCTPWRQSRGAQTRQVESAQKLCLQVLQQVLHVNVVFLLQNGRVHHSSMPVPQTRSRTNPLMSRRNRAAMSTERHLEQQEANQQEHNLGGANGSQFRAPNARHGRNNPQQSSLCPLGWWMGELMQQEEVLTFCLLKSKSFVSCRSVYVEAAAFLLTQAM